MHFTQKGVELSDEDAGAIFKLLASSSDGELSDNDLENIAGGKINFFKESLNDFKAGVDHCSGKDRMIK